MSLFYSTLCWGTEESFSSNRTATDLNSQKRFALAWEQSSSAASGQGNKPWEKVPWAEGLLLANPALPCSQLHAAQQTQQWGWGLSNIMQETCDRFRAHILQLLLSWPAPYGMNPGERYCSQASKVGGEASMELRGIFPSGQHWLSHAVVSTSTQWVTELTSNHHHF